MQSLQVSAMQAAGPVVGQDMQVMEIPRQQQQALQAARARTLSEKVFPLKGQERPAISAQLHHPMAAAAAAVVVMVETEEPVDNTAAAAVVAATAETVAMPEQLSVAAAAAVMEVLAETVPAVAAAAVVTVWTATEEPEAAETAEQLPVAAETHPVDLEVPVEMALLFLNTGGLNNENIPDLRRLLSLGRYEHA